MFSIRENAKNKQVFISIDNATSKVKSGLRAALTEIGRENSKHTKKLIKNPPKTGRFYVKSGMRHQASAPGEAPATLTGKLIKSIGYRVFGSYKMEFGDRAPYGKFLEDGTRRMAARPHLVTTVTQKSKDTFISIAMAVDKRLQKL